MPTVNDLMRELERFRGQRYVFGAEIPLSMDPTGVGPVDCSELTSVAVRRLFGGSERNCPDGAYNQWAKCRERGLLITRQQAISTRGALLFYDDGSGTGRDRVPHVAVSMGNGTTFEAWTTGKPVGNYDATRSKFTIGGLIPELTYENPPPTGGGPTGGWEDLRNLHETSPRMKGDDVKAAQILLRGWGHDPGDIDGVWGPVCTTACKGYQRAEGLTADGQFGPRTRSRANGA